MFWHQSYLDVMAPDRKNLDVLVQITKVAIYNKHRGRKSLNDNKIDRQTDRQTDRQIDR